jgi:hypothetical protein
LNGSQALKPILLSLSRKCPICSLLFYDNNDDNDNYHAAQIRNRSVPTTNASGGQPNMVVDYFVNATEDDADVVTLDVQTLRRLMEFASCMATKRRPAPLMDA